MYQGLAEKFNSVEGWVLALKLPAKTQLRMPQKEHHMFPRRHSVQT